MYNIHNLNKGRGFMQSQKQFILDIVRSSHSHLTAEQILGLARERRPRIAVGTVYRNLSALCEQGELRSIVVPESPVIYDGTLSPHDHMVCRRCGKLKDVVLPLELLPLLRQSVDAAISDYSLCIGYICEECREK